MSEDNLKSLMLLRLRDTDTYIVVPGVNFNPDDPEHEKRNAYWVEEHTCPSNLTGFPVLTVDQDGLNADPHGVLEFIEEVEAPAHWGSCGPRGDNADVGYLLLFPTLKQIVDEKMGKVLPPEHYEISSIEMLVTAAQFKQLADRDMQAFQFPFEWHSAEKWVREDFETRAAQLMPGKIDEHLLINVTHDKQRLEITLHIAANDALGARLVEKLHACLPKGTP